MSARSLYAIECSDCDAVVVCDVVRDMMDIRGLDGWTFPPVRCPSCSVAASVSHSSVAIGSECQWCHCVGYHSEVCKGFEINDAARAAVVSHPRPDDEGRIDIVFDDDGVTTTFHGAASHPPSENEETK